MEVHISGLRRCLEAHGPRVIFTVRNRGYVLVPGGSPADAAEVVAAPGRVGGRRAAVSLSVAERQVP